MNWVAFQIASGRVFFVALALLFLAAVVAPAAAPRLRRWATWFLLLGLGTVAVAATPLPIWAAALLLVPVAVPMVAERPGRQVVMFELPLPPFYERFGRVQRALAARHGAHLVPKRILLSVIAAADATVDSIHLTQQGHERMADLTWAIVGPALPAGLHRP